MEVKMRKYAQMENTSQTLLLFLGNMISSQNNHKEIAQFARFHFARFARFQTFEAFNSFILK
jgi:ribosomal protein RSM22 (predicted rRNA methylase)